MKAGVNFINEPRLFITFNSGKGVAQHTYLTDDINGPISNVTLNDGDASANIPLKQYAFYVQDDWAVTGRLTINLGLRYDLIDGFQFDQSLNPNFVIMQNAGARRSAGRHQGPRELRPEPEERHQQLAAASRLRLRRPRQRPGRDPRRLGHLHGHGLHQLERAVRGQRRHGQGLRRGAVGGQPVGHPQPGRQLLPGRPAAVEHPEPEPGESERDAAVRPVHRSAAADAVHAADLARLVAPAGGEHGVHGGLRPRRRPRPERASAHQHRHRRWRRHVSAAAGVPEPRPRRHRHPAGDQRRREQVHRPHHRHQAPHAEQRGLHASPTRWPRRRARSARRPTS